MLFRSLGAFFITLIFIFIYSILISIGILLYIKTYTILKKKYNLYIILITSSLIINISYIDAIFKFMSNGWINIVIVYIIPTYILAIILSLFIPTKKR